MRLKLTIKQRKKSRHYRDLAIILERLNKINSFDIDSQRINKGKIKYVISGNINPIEVYQMITSSGYSILESKIIQDNKQNDN